jgi:enoyl-CoA hydratase/carnithine racemase
VSDARSDDIRSSVSAGVMTVQLARPSKKNALHDAMYGALVLALRQAQTDTAVRVVMLCAEGGDFTAGNDVADFVAAAASGRTLADMQVARFLQALADFDKPIVAAVQGRAIGIGLTMLLHCDLVYVATDASLSAPFVSLGLIPEAASSLLLPQRIGHARAFAVFALGEKLSGIDAVSLGLANQALPAAELQAHALHAAQLLAKQPQEALRATRGLMRNPAAIWKVMQTEVELFTQRLVSAEAQAVFAAFAARKPR